MTRALPAHITVDDAAGKADCDLCKMGVTAPPSFGGIPRHDMLSAFIILHSSHAKSGVPNGLTPTGRPSKAARSALAEAVGRG